MSEAKSSISATLSRDFISSIVVFLVALPLCMGIAVASGMPPQTGLITGIVGGIVVGALAGSPLQVSGPAAGLAVLVFEIVREQGVAALAIIVILAGAMQILAGAARIGHWFRAISPAIVHGMLAGIGLLIVASQLHVLLDRSPLPNGLSNLAAVPGAFVDLSPVSVGSAEWAFALGAITIASFLAWEKFRPKALTLVPGALIGVVTATLIAVALRPDVKRVVVPANLLEGVKFPTVADITAGLTSPPVLITALVIAFIASAETLLSAAAVDRMHDGPRTQYNKELVSQGVGNMICGFIGGLPMTGVIVRSSANVQAGAATRLSTMLHGTWILGFVMLLPWVLREMPTAALAGVLVVTGWRLVKISHATHLFNQYGALPAAIWAVTFVMVVVTDLLTGVLTGLALSLLEIIPHLHNLKLDIEQKVENEVTEIALTGSATFVNLPKLANRLDTLPDGGRIKLNFGKLSYLDHTCAEMITDWVSRKAKRGTTVEYDLGGNDRVGQILGAH
jgi:MFS superfamily sulfate permease-like transporter